MYFRPGAGYADYLHVARAEHSNHGSEKDYTGLKGSVKVELIQ